MDIYVIYFGILAFIAILLFAFAVIKFGVENSTRKKAHLTYCVKCKKSLFLNDVVHYNFPEGIFCKYCGENIEIALRQKDEK